MFEAGSSSSTSSFLVCSSALSWTCRTCRYIGGTTALAVGTGVYCHLKVCKKNIIAFIVGMNGYTGRRSGLKLRIAC